MQKLQIVLRPARRLPAKGSPWQDSAGGLEGVLLLLGTGLGGGFEGRGEVPGAAVGKEPMENYRVLSVSLRDSA